MRRRIGLVALVFLSVAAGAWGLTHRTLAPRHSGQEPIGLFTSLPILWSEQADLRKVLAAPESAHWVKTEFERHGTVIALDTLLDLARFDRLVVAQPRPLSPDENVALDRWVRAGGRLLLFADPMLTEESAFALGDRRRPQDVVLISPILGRWGLELRFDDQQPGGLRESAGEAMPVNLSGQLASRAGGVDSRCTIGPQALIARCKVGKGRVLIVADAALLESDSGSEARQMRLGALFDETFGN
ncbi:MAG: ABC transporter [Novosphingobium sp.]|nr:ABC transporter [Novosphingobium sp.]